MAWYDVGSISVTNGSTTVTGTGTDFISGVQVGEGLYISGDLYEIATIVSGTQLTLADAYLGSTATGQDYKIIPTQSLVADLSSGVADLISDFADVRDYAGSGKFNDGTASSPAITFTQDQNNGLYRIGSDNWGLVAGGEKIVDVSTNGIKLDDNNKATFGTGNDLQIYHDGSHSWIKDVGTGDLTVSGDNLYLEKGDGTKFLYGVSSTGQVRLYYGDAQKFITTSTGVDVTGTVTADGLSLGSATGRIINLYESAGDIYGFSMANLGDGFSTNIIGGQGGSVKITTRPAGGSNTERLKVGANGDVSFFEDTGTTAKMVWDASAESLGIGTSSPNSKLEVATSSNPNNISDGAIQVVSSDPLAFVAPSNLNPTINRWGFKLREGGEGTFSIHDHRHALTRMLIDSSGNVGIGTASPTAIGGHSGILNLKGSNATALVLQTATDRKDLRFSNGALKITNSSGTNQLVVDSAGNVGIGTGSPNRPLTVRSGGTTMLAEFKNPSNTQSHISFANSASSADQVRVGSNSGNLVLSTNYSEKARIDSSGNLLVGKTSGTITAAGHDFYNSGVAYHVASGISPLELNRLSNDGDILTFRKDTTAVGSIKSRAGLVSTIILDPRSGGGGLTGTAGGVEPVNESGNNTDGLFSLGTAASRFKDLYLSGGVYLGGTGAANKLDDYEEGVWTPVFWGSSSSPTVTYSEQFGAYVKVGDLVHVQGRVTVDTVSGGAGALSFAGLPFVSYASAYYNSTLNVTRVSNFNTDHASGMQSIMILNGTTTGYLYRSNDLTGGASTFTTADIKAGSTIVFSGTYRA